MKRIQRFPCEQWCPTSRDHCAAEYHGCQMLESLFDRSEVIGVGKQAALEIAVDESATKGKAEAPAQRVKPLPGQTEMEG